MGTSRLSKTEIASRFIAGANCSQCVLSQWADELGYDEEELCRMAAAFGGGMFRGDTCGAVTGALIAIGLAYGDDNDAVHEKVDEFREKFIARCGALNCRDLIKYDLALPGEKEKALESGVMIDYCPNLVVAALEILDDMFADL